MMTFAVRIRVEPIHHSQNNRLRMFARLFFRPAHAVSVTICAVTRAEPTSNFFCKPPCVYLAGVLCSNEMICYAHFSKEKKDSMNDRRK